MSKSSKRISEIEQEGRKIKLDMFRKFCQVREGHPGSILSIFDIVNVLYLGGFMQVERNSNINDVFIIRAFLFCVLVENKRHDYLTTLNVKSSSYIIDVWSAPLPLTTLISNV